MAPPCIQSNIRKAKAESLWMRFFKDPSQWWDNRNSKASARSPDFKHKVTAEALWLDCRYDPTWFFEELRKTGPTWTLELSKGEPQEERGAVFPEETAHVVGLLKVCAKQKDLYKGTRLHEDIRKRGLLERSPYVAPTLITMYAKCGALAKAQQVLDECTVHDRFSWTALIAGYAQNGHGDEALKCFDKMRQEGHFPDLVAFTCALKACASVGALDKGEQIHGEIVRWGLLEKFVVLGNALVDMYAKCGALAKAQEVFDELPVQNVVTWNALIAGYANCGQGKEALKCFEKMQQVGHFPDSISFTCALKACANVGALDKGEQICDEIVRLGWLGRECVLGNSIVNMYAKCGAFAKAEGVLYELPIRDVFSWSSLITGYAQHRQGKEALKCFDKMRWEGHIPDPITFSSSLKACADIGAIDKGEEIHEEIVRLGLLEGDVVLGSALVDMYAKCGALEKAHEVLDELPVRNVVSWSALIAGYAQHGQGKEALKCLDKMRHDGHYPTAVTFISALKACANIGAIDKGKEIHEEVVRLGCLGRNVVLGNALVDMYAKCGALAKAQEVLDELPIRNVVSWNALIAGYAQHGQGKEALECFDKMRHEMRHEGHFPDSVAFTCALNACAIVGALDKGQQIHDEIVRWGLLEKSVELGSALVDMYAKCGALEKAQGVLDELPVQDAVTWNALIAGYANGGQGKEALKCFEKMRQVGHFPDSVSFTCALKACANVGALDKGEQICDEIVRLGWLGRESVLGNSVVNMYAKCGAFAKAEGVLYELPVRDVFSWSSLITGYAQHGQGKEALKCFDKMRWEGHIPDPVTFSSSLKACADIGDMDKGEEIHEDIVRLGLLEGDVVLGNALVDMYAKCGAFAKAEGVLDKLPGRNAVAWTALMAGYAQHGQGEEALKCFDKMRHEGHSPSAITFICALKACADVGAAEKGEEIHDEINRLGWLERESVLGYSVVNMYAKCGAFAKAEGVLYELPVRDVGSWNSLIAGYAQHGQGKEALKCFDKMRWEGHIPDTVTFLSALKACADIGAIDKGKEIHEEIVRLGLLEGDVVFGSALVDLYAKCGRFTKAREVLDELPARDVVSWTALIAGYASHGRSADVLDCFEQMQCEGISPNAGTFVCVLNACSHSGLLDEGQMYFTKMSAKFGVTPDAQHHCCMVDLFGRAGEFTKALAVIEMMPSSDDLPVWMALLGACRKWKNVRLGRLAFDRILQIDKTAASAYVCMANIYAAAGKQEDAGEIEVMRVANKAWKKPGCCWWTDDRGNTRAFLVGEQKYPQSKYIYKKLQDLTEKMSWEGYSLSLGLVSQNIYDDMKKDVLCGHSEKLAIACALINTLEGSTVSVVKNMWACNDCHRATALISEIEKRKIVVRDANHVHIFEHGKCSCKDYW